MPFVACLNGFFGSGFKEPWVMVMPQGTSEKS